MAETMTDRRGADEAVAQAKRFCEPYGPHAWELPSVRDDELVCCGCHLRVSLLALGDTFDFLTGRYLEWMSFEDALTLAEAYDAALADARRRQSATQHDSGRNAGRVSPG